MGNLGLMLMSRSRFQALGRNQAALTGGESLQSDNPETFPDLSVLRKIYATKFEQNLSSEMLFEDQRGQDAHKIVKELSDTKTSAVEEQHSQARKRISDRNSMSKRLREEAERYFEGFTSNVDTDISSLDGERSDGSTTLGMKERDAAINMNGYKPLDSFGVHELKSNCSSILQDSETISRACSLYNKTRI